MNNGLINWNMLILGVILQCCWLTETVNKRSRMADILWAYLHSLIIALVKICSRGLRIRNSRTLLVKVWDWSSKTREIMVD